MSYQEEALNNGSATTMPTSSESGFVETSIYDEQQLRSSRLSMPWNNSFSSAATFKTVPSLNSLPVHNFVISPEVDHFGHLTQSQHLFESELNGVTIQQKIELALELVKTHLVFTVSDEINALKEEICRLSTRKSQLEYENSFLRLHATPETLSHISSLREGKIKCAQFFLD